MLMILKIEYYRSRKINTFRAYKEKHTHASAI